MILLTYTCSLLVNGLPIVPCAQADGMGNTVAVSRCDDPIHLEKLQRKVTLELGLLTQIAQAGMRVGDLKRCGVLGSTSLAWHIGRAIYQARQEKTSIVDAIVRTLSALCSIQRGKYPLTFENSPAPREPLWPPSLHW